MVHVQTSIGLQRAALISGPDLRALVLPGSYGASGCGIWEELKSNCVAQSGSCACAASVARSAFAVVVPQFGLPISEYVAKIHRRFVVHFYGCCHALNKLDSSASRLSSVLATLGTLRPQALRPSKSRAFHGLRM